jgi:hypothetical protein
MRTRLLVALSGAAMLAGCSIYPLPEDVTGFESKHIVQIVRCQARDAVRAEVQRTLLAPLWADAVIYNGKTGRETAAWLRENPDNYLRLKLADFAPQAARLYRNYGDTMISYDFTLDATEMNTAGLDLNFLKAFTGGSTTIGLKATNERTRQVRRNSRHYDNFDNLARNLSNEYCDGVPTSENPLYPSTGLIKVRTLIRDFVDQNQRNNLGSKDNALTAEMNETIIFTTKFVGNLDPSSSLNPVSGIFVPSQIKANLDNYRQDMHTIIVLVQLPDKRDKALHFDAFGRLTAVGKSAIDDKFQEIRSNNYVDDINKVANSVTQFVR